MRTYGSVEEARRAQAATAIRNAIGKYLLIRLGVTVVILIVSHLINKKLEQTDES